MRNSTVPRNVVAALALLALLAGCSAPSGGNSSQGTSSDSSDPSDSSGSGDSGDAEGDDSFVPVKVCELIPDDVLETALGSGLDPNREEYQGSGCVTCRIYTTSRGAHLNVEMSRSGRDGFETQRGYKEPIADLYQPLTGIGDDAFAFGSEVTVLQGEYVAVIYLEGLDFDPVPEGERLERAKPLAIAAAETLSTAS